jgi:Adenylate and Guanylate cyclase catalytic domain
MLPQGTADLALRIGLNSGPTTAGVLSGEKSRFQLFGDVSGGVLVRCLLPCYNLKSDLNVTLL